MIALFGPFKTFDEAFSIGCDNFGLFTIIEEITGEKFINQERLELE